MQRFLTLSLVVALLALVAVTPGARARVAERAEPVFTLDRFPVGSTNIDFQDTWGARRPGGRRHRGTDIIGERGTPIVAVADGVVAFIGMQRLSGYTIKLDHGNGWSSAYLHLNNDEPGTDNGEGGEETAFAPWLSDGVPVHAGEVIGYLGDSGNAERTTPHLHFELKHDGEKVNPFPYVEAAWGRSEVRRIMARLSRPAAPQHARILRRASTRTAFP